MGRVLWEVFPDAIGTIFERECRRAVETTVPVAFEELYPPLNREVDVRAFPSDIGLTVLARDISAEHAERQALRNREEPFRMLADSMPQIVWKGTANGSNNYLNARWVEYTGLTREESYGEGWFVAFHPADRARASSSWHEATASKGPLTLECRLRRADGVYRWWLIRGVCLLDANGEIARWLGSCTDIDDLKQAQHRIAQQAALIDEVRDGIIVQDLANTIQSWSRGAERLYGWAAQEVVGRPLDEVLHTSNLGASPQIDEILQRGEWSGEMNRTTRSGSVLTVESRWTVLHDQNGAPRGILMLDSDITKRKKAELRLHESEERHRLLFNRNPHPMWVYDCNTLAFLAVNDAAVRHYGYSESEFLGMTIKNIRPPSEVATLMRVLHEKPEGSTPEVFGVFKHAKKDGTVIEVEIASSEIVYADRRAGLVIAVDVTDRHRLEQQLMRIQRMESIGTLASGIAHDLNNILMPVMMGIALLKREKPSERSLKAIGNMEKSAMRGKDLVQQVLSFARGVDGSRVTIHLHDLIHEIRSFVEATFPKNIDLQVDVPRDLWWVEADPTQLNQVLVNLCVNARDAMPNGGRLRISARNEQIDQHYAAMNRDLSSGSHVLIEVADDGVGIPAAMVDRIFEPFYTTKDLGHGTGLGLSTVAAIVRAHHGSVNVYSEVGKGSAFRIYLRSRPAGGQRSTGEQRLQALPKGDGQLLLVADDDISVLNITQQTLEAFGYRVLPAQDGAQAIAHFATRRSEIAAVITDMMMPVMDGPALIAALRRIDPKVRIVASSGLSDRARAARSVNGEVSHFLQKPYSAELLLETLQSAIGKG